MRTEAREVWNERGSAYRGKTFSVARVAAEERLDSSAFAEALAVRDARVTGWLSVGVGVGSASVSWGHGPWLAVVIVPLAGLIWSVGRLLQLAKAHRAGVGADGAAPPPRTSTTS